MTAFEPIMAMLPPSPPCFSLDCLSVRGAAVALGYSRVAASPMPCRRLCVRETPKQSNRHLGLRGVALWCFGAPQCSSFYSSCVCSSCSSGVRSGDGHDDRNEVGTCDHRVLYEGFSCHCPTSPSGGGCSSSYGMQPGAQRSFCGCESAALFARHRWQQRNDRKQVCDGRRYPGSFHSLSRGVYFITMVWSGRPGNACTAEAG